MWCVVLLYACPNDEQDCTIKLFESYLHAINFYHEKYVELPDLQFSRVLKPCFVPFKEFRREELL